MTLQATRYEQLQRRTGRLLNQTLIGPWRRRSVGVLALLFGFIIGSNVTMIWFQRSGQNRPVAVLAMVLIIELIVRLRSKVRPGPWPLPWLALDNLRIGTVYAVVLEAYKLGS
ncbi:hypothetical protein SynBIOSE41_02198 [Synechococcus sp. BIOS-E4-1]|uniref:DUF565 domain-containing protein n=1 Tax=Synechococcus sp. BIOS-E4-1 TaxID=1400864 RepID=UPI001646D9F6|nr:DUF565 domain-containing protein [Synechococcus sp. BIOS-E4-1]QNI54701.1 hypothetical protein SynBIOSE41_02198 [Synechococcus sp. BIOS-E4-1]